MFRSRDNDEIILSVIIPTRDRPSLVRLAMASVAAQGRNDVEVVVVDDGSASPCDFTGIIRSDRLKVLTHQSPLGAARARNAGILAASGHWFAFLDDDDEWEEGFVEATMRVLTRGNDQLMFSWCSIKNIDYGPDGRPIGERRRIFADHHSSKQSLIAEALCIGTSWGLTVNRACFEKVGLFDETYRFVEDTELILRLLSAGCEPAVVAGVLVRIHHRMDPMRLSNAEKFPARIRECRQLMARYNHFLDRHPAAAGGLAAHVATLEAAVGLEPCQQ